MSRLTHPTNVPFAAVLFSFLLFLGACQAVIHEKGTILDPRDVAKIEVGKTNMAQVKAILGVPTFVNSFRKNQWSYVQDRQFKNLQRTFSRVVNRVEITFNKRGIVEDLQHNFDETLLNPKEMPEAQNDQNWMRWLWGGEYMQPATKRLDPRSTPETTNAPKEPEESLSEKVKADPWWKF